MPTPMPTAPSAKPAFETHDAVTAELRFDSALEAVTLSLHPLGGVPAQSASASLFRRKVLIPSIAPTATNAAPTPVRIQPVTRVPLPSPSGCAPGVVSASLGPLPGGSGAGGSV